MKGLRWQRFVWGSFGFLTLLLQPGLCLDPENRISQYRRTHWTVAEGLPQSTVFAGVQDKDGFIWLGTQEGLARFDGLNFKVYNRTNTPVLRSNSITALFTDEKGRIWIGTERGLYIYERGRIYEPADSEAYKNIWVWCLSQDDSGRIYVGTEEKGLLVVENEVLAPSPIAWDFQRGAVYAVEPTADNQGLWVGDARGLFKVNADNAQQLSKADGFPYGPVYELLMSKRGDLWLCIDEGLVRYRGTESRLFTEADGLDSSLIYAIFEDPDENLWVGTAAGLNCIRENGIELESPNTKDVFNPINAIWGDGEGNLWVGRSNDGLFSYTDVRMTTFTQEEGLIHDFVWAVIEDAQGRMVVGTDHGLSRYDGKSFESITTENGLQNNHIRSLEMGPQNDLWVGTARGVVTRLTEAGSQHFDLGMAGRSRNSITSMSFCSKGRLWLGSDSGLFFLENGVFKRPKGPLVNEAIVHVRCDSSGTIWVSTASRVGYYQDSDPNTFRELSLPKTAEILCFYRDGRGNMWLGTYGQGLWRFDGANMVMITKDQGLFDNTVYAILEDSGFFWMSSNRGIYKVAIEDLGAVASGRARSLESTHFGIGDGMKSVECNGGTWPVGVKTKSGHFWFATTWGVVRTDPDNTGPEMDPPPIHFTHLQADGEPLALEESIQTTAKAKQLLISYTAVSFRHAELLHFRYRLKGFNDQWQHVGARRTAYFNHLPKGVYQFEVMATIGQNPWPRQAETLEIVVTRSWFLHPFLIPLLGSLLFLVMLLYLCLRLRNASARTRKVMGLMEQTEQKVSRLEGTWGHMQEEYLDTIVEAGMGEMAGKVLQAVNQGLEDIQHRILKVENTIRGPNLDQRLRKLIPKMKGLAEPGMGASNESDSLEDLENFSATLKTLRGNMLEEVVGICDEIHAIGEMVEVQQDYAILDQKIDTINLATLMSDVLRMQSPYLKSSKLTFRNDWHEVPPIKAHVLKLFLTLCGIVRQIARATSPEKKSLRLGHIHLSQEGKFVELILWAPEGENLRALENSISKLTFLQEIQWLLGEKAKGELTFLKENHRQGYRLRLLRDDSNHG